MIRAYHQRARRPRAHRDHRAGRRARHQSGDRDDVRLHGARDPVAAERRHRPRGAEQAAVGPQTAGIMLTNPSTLGVFERRIDEVAEHRARRRRPAVLRRREPQRDPRQGAPGRHGLRRHPHEPAQDLLDAARRRRPRLRCGRRRRATAAVPAGSGRRARRRRVIAGSTSATCRRPSAGCRRSWATPACCCAPTSTCACSAARACTRVAEFADAQRQLPAGASAAGAASTPAYPGAARATSSSSRCSARGTRARRQRDGLRQAPARLRLPCADRRTSRCWCRSAC